MCEKFFIRWRAFGFPCTSRSSSLNMTNSSRVDCLSTAIDFQDRSGQEGPAIAFQKDEWMRAHKLRRVSMSACVAGGERGGLVLVFDLLIPSCYAVWRVGQPHGPPDHQMTGGMPDLYRNICSPSYLELFAKSTAAVSNREWIESGRRY